MEGEYGSGGDYFEVNGERIIDQEGSDEDIFDGSISDSFTRNPTYANNDGLDLDVFDVSDKVNNGDTSATLKSATGGDRYTPSMFAFSTELYVPDICYDYTVDLGTGANITNEGLHITGPISKDGNMTTKVLIKSLEGDLDLLNTTLTVKDLNATNFDFTDAAISPNDTFAYIPAIIIDPSASNSKIAFGNPDDDMSDGGTISPDQLLYAKFYHEYKGVGLLDERINIDLVTHLDFGSGPVEYHYSTDGTHLTLDRCPRDLTYSPVHGIFNVERIGTNASDPENIKYPLYTQISGKDFDVSVVAYDANNTSNNVALEDVGVELELIDAGSFENNASVGFDSICQDYEKENIFATQFVPFPTSTPAERVDITESNGFQTNDYAVDVALRSAAFRVWYIADGNNSLVIPAACYQPNLTYSEREVCFQNIYNDIKNNDNTLDPNDICLSNCSGGTDCYECLKINFGHPVCSRDNFAIRPETFRLTILDDKEGNTSVTPKLITINNGQYAEKHFAAGYQYRLDGNATLYGLDQNAKKYYKSFASYDPAPSPLPIDRALFEFKSSSGTSCPDTDSKTLKLTIDNGEVDSNKADNGIISHDNVGDYNLSIVDSNWTIVDQKGSQYKPFPDVADCLSGSSLVAATGDMLSGCMIESVYDTTHTIIDLEFEPYAFDITSFSLKTNPNDNNIWVYMNNLNDSTAMSAYLDGNVTALGANGAQLSNFVATCAAEDVIMWLDRNMSDSGENFIYPEANNTNQVAFQQMINPVSGVTELEDNINDDMNATLRKVNFTVNNDANGTTPVELHYNFKKPYDGVVNPVRVGFEMLHAASPNASSNVDLKTAYIPDGNVSIDANRTFYYARVVEAPGTDDRTIMTPDTSTSTTFSVQMFCRDSVDITCATLPGLTAAPPASPQEAYLTGAWYTVETHDSTKGEGQLLDLSSSVNGVSFAPAPSINDSTTALDFSNNGITQAVTISYPLVPRPVHPVITMTPDPWLKFEEGDAAGLPSFVLHFLTQGLMWKGTGNTGNVISTQPGTSVSPRLNW